MDIQVTKAKPTPPPLTVTLTLTVDEAVELRTLAYGKCRWDAIDLIDRVTKAIAKVEPSVIDRALDLG